MSDDERALARHTRHPLLDRPALTPTLTVRLGIKQSGGRGDYPKEVDHFVLKPEDGATPEIQQLYGKAPKKLWVMLPYGAPVPGHPSAEDDLSVSVYNMAWSWTQGLLCKGTGKDRYQQGDAESSSEAFARRIGELIDAKPQLNEQTGRWRIPCLGVDCPKFRTTVAVDKNGSKVEQIAPGHDPDAMCRLQVRFEALLLDPKVEKSADPRSDPPRVLAVMKLASSSINSIKGIVDGLFLMRAMTQSPWAPAGRTNMLPFRLVRQHKITTRGGVRAAHFTLAIEPTPDVWSRWLRVPPSGMFLSTAQLDDIRQQLAAEITFREVEDIVPRPAELQAHNPLREDLVQVAVPQGTDVDDALADAERPAPANNPPDSGYLAPPREEDQPASPADIRALKDLLGGREDPNDPRSPARAETTENIRSWLRRWYEEHDQEVPQRFRYSAITVGQVRWIQQQVLPDPPEDYIDGGSQPPASAPAESPEQPPASESAEPSAEPPQEPGLFDKGGGA